MLDNNYPVCYNLITIEKGIKKMTINTNVAIVFSVEEKWILDKASSLMLEIARTLPDEKLISLETGEVVEIAELGRVSGILNGFANSLHWET